MTKLDYLDVFVASIHCKERHDFYRDEGTPGHMALDRVLILKLS